MTSSFKVIVATLVGIYILRILTGKKRNSKKRGRDVLATNPIGHIGDKTLWRQKQKQTYWRHLLRTYWRQSKTLSPLRLLEQCDQSFFDKIAFLES